MRQDTHDQEKQRAIHERNRQHTHDDMQARKDQEFYARMGLSGPETETSLSEDTFVISVHRERWTHEDLEAGETSAHDIELDHVTVDAEELKRHGQDYGFSEASCSDPEMSIKVWFSSTSPREDRTYFEQGVQKYYSLHIHDANGHRPEPADYQRIANLINIRFDHAFNLQEANQDGPGLSP